MGVGWETESEGEIKKEREIEGEWERERAKEGDGLPTLMQWIYQIIFLLTFQFSSWGGTPPPPPASRSRLAYSSLATNSCATGMCGTLQFWPPEPIYYEQNTNYQYENRAVSTFSFKNFNR